LRNSFIDTILVESEKRGDIFIITGDAGLGVFDEFRERYPERFLNLGVAEQNATSFAAGLAMTGFKVYLYNIIPFLLYRPYEQIRNDICCQRLPVCLVGVGSGITLAPGGMSHYSVEDLGIIQTLPNLTVLSPADPLEAVAGARYSLNCSYPLYVRLAKKGEDSVHREEPSDITEPLVLKKGTEGISIIFHGSIAKEVINASTILEGCGIDVQIISIPLIQPFKKESALKLLKGSRYVLSVEEHFVNCGLGSIIKKAVFDERPSWKLETLGIDYSFIHHTGDQRLLREYFGISAHMIAETIKDFASKGG